MTICGDCPCDLVSYVQRQPHAAGWTCWTAEEEIVQPLTADDADIDENDEAEESSSSEFPQEPFCRLSFALNE